MSAKGNAWVRQYDVHSADGKHPHPHTSTSSTTITHKHTHGTWRGVRLRAVRPGLDDGSLGPAPEHRHPQLAVERVRHDAEELVAGVGGQAVDKQAEEDGGEDLAEEHRQARLALLPRGAQQADQGGDAWREREECVRAEG